MLEDEERWRGEEAVGRAEAVWESLLRICLGSRCLYSATRRAWRKLSSVDGWGGEEARRRGGGWDGV